MHLNMFNDSLFEVVNENSKIYQEFFLQQVSELAAIFHHNKDMLLAN